MRTSPPTCGRFLNSSPNIEKSSAPGWIAPRLTHVMSFAKSVGSGPAWATTLAVAWGPVGFQLGDLNLTDFAGGHLAVTAAAGLIPLHPGQIKRIVGHPDAFGPVISTRRCP
jgi:hypothetical protein